jgi:RNA polymerase sigma-70 factor (ECF subfamily)
MNAATITPTVILRPRPRSDAIPDDGRVPADASDVALIRRIAAGDGDALSDAYAAHGAMIFGVAMRMLGDHQLAEECTQDVLMSLWRNADRIDPGRARLGTWLYVVTKNRALSLQRSRGTRPATPVAEVPVAAEAPDTAQLVERGDRARRLAEAMASLPDEQRDVVTLAYFHGMTQEQIASRLDLPLGTVKGRARLALDRMRATLGPGDRDGGGAS